MADVGSMFGGVTGGGGFIEIVTSILLGVVGIGLAVGFSLFLYKKKKGWNIKVEFRIPRDVNILKNPDGTSSVKGTIVKEWGKGLYDAKRGVVFIKRDKMKPVAIKPFNVKEILSGRDNILTVIQVGVEDYRPVIEQSYLEVIDSESGEEAALIKARIDTSESKSWKNSFERDSKSVYTVGSFLREHGQLIGFGFILLSVFVGFAVVYSKIG